MATTRRARIFDVELNFHRQARRPGGVSRAKAIAQAQARIEQGKPEFVMWLGAEMKLLQKVLRQAEQNSADSATIDQALYHSRQMRDVGSTMGFELVTFIADQLCDMLEAVKAGARYDKDMVGCHVDALNLAAQKRYQHLRPEELPELSAGLRGMFKKLQHETTANLS